jgi:hypothetical protein
MAQGPPASQNQTATETHASLSPASIPGGQFAYNSEQSVTQDAGRLLTGLYGDQRRLWTSPLRLRSDDAEWAVPIGGVATGLIMTDRTSSHELTRGSHEQLSNDLSNAGLGMLGFTAGSMYFLGARSGDGHLRESGLLATESAVDSLGVDEVLAYSLRRARPGEDSGSGRFFQSGDSFPAIHATTAFAIATVLASEYPGPLTRLLAYGTASAISMARVTAGRHFSSDVFVGGVLGYFIGRSVYARHHNPEVESFGTFNRPESASLPREAMGSTYIELDSWVYPAIERLAAQGIVRGEYLGLRPWTRMSVYQMLSGVDTVDLDPFTAQLVTSLRAELSREAELEAGSPNQSISLDEIYTRSQSISGTPLNDSYHFGQTITDDFGRRYGQGYQQVTGFETGAEQGRFSFFVRGEYQHSPNVPGYSQSVAQVIAAEDTPCAVRPCPAPTAIQNYPNQPSRDVFRLLDTYASVKFFGHDISVGKQSYWWGPGSGSAMILSNNAEPFYSLRINRAMPLHIPLLSKLLGPFRYDNFFGKLSGHKFPPQPFFFGQKVNFLPTENLELGFSRDAVFAGQGVAPLTFGTFWHSFTSASSGIVPGFQLRNDPGARHGSFDFRYRLPGLRNRLTLYADSLVHDDLSPVDAPRRAAVTPGIYLTRFPGIRKLDLHVEGGTTDSAGKSSEGGQLYYWEGIYRDGNTNKGYLLGSWLGREGTGGQAWTTYWLSPRSTLQFGFRTLKVSWHFVPQGLSQTDAYACLRYEWKNGLALQFFAQGERWAAPVLALTPQTNVTTQMQLSFRPANWKLLKQQ